MFKMFAVFVVIADVCGSCLGPAAPPAVRPCDEHADVGTPTDHAADCHSASLRIHWDSVRWENLGLWRFR